MPARGAELVERLIQQDGVQFVLGPYSSGLTKAIGPVTEQYQVPMVQANGASRSLFTNGWRYMFATLSTSEQYLTSAIALTVGSILDESGLGGDALPGALFTITLLTGAVMLLMGLPVLFLITDITDRLDTYLARGLAISADASRPYLPAHEQRPHDALC